MASGADLFNAAKTQQSYAEAGYPLASFQAEVIPPEMLQPATNTEGAYLKSAYWLATAARLAYAAKKNGAALLPMVQDYLNKGDPGVLNRLYGSVGRVSGQSSDPKAIGEILQVAASAANQMGVANIATTLKALGQSTAIFGRQTSLDQGTLTFTEKIQNVLSLGLYAKLKPYASGLAISTLLLLVVGGIAAYVYRRSLKGAAGKTAKAGATLASILI